MKKNYSYNYILTLLAISTSLTGCFGSSKSSPSATTSGGTTPKSGLTSLDPVSSLSSVVIDSVSPASGPLSGGQTITISGTFFKAGAAVLVNTSPCTSVAVSSDTQISCNTPASAAGIYSITVTNSDQTGATLNDAYTYRAAPTLISILPSAGILAGGTNVTLSGTGFVDGASVLIAGNNCTGLVVVSPTQITCNTPIGIVGAVNVTVTNADTQSTTLFNGFNYFNVLQISPSTQTLVSGDSTTLTASGGIAPYSFEIISGAGDVDSGSGIYNSTSNGTDVVQVTDSVGNTSNATVIVNVGMGITSASPITMVNSQQLFTAIGGIPPYSFTVTSGAGTIDSTTGMFFAPANAENSDVQVSDSAGHSISTTITVVAVLSLTPASRTMGSSQTLQFLAAGGVAPITYSIVSGVGSINSGTGLYTATADPGTTVVRATDALSNVFDSTITVVKPTKIKASAGGAFACALFSNSLMKCWGNNTYGQLLQGNKVQMGDGANEMGSDLPFINLGTGRTVVDFDLGLSHACAILDNGSLKCWGRNNYGQLGQGSTATRGDGVNEIGNGLATINLGAGRTATKIGLGSYQTCVILDNNELKCWGYGLYGQLGQGNTLNLGDAPSETPDLIPAIDLGTNRFATQIAAGLLHTCILLDNSNVKCFGRNNTGQLGLGLATSVVIGDGLGEMGDALNALNLGTGLSVISIAAGKYHSCAILSNQRLKCWGQGSLGQLGKGNNATLGDAPAETGDGLTFVNLGTIQTVSGLSLGYNHTCVILTNSELKCFGAGASGGLGSGGIANLGDAAAEMGDSLLALNLGTGLSVQSASGGLSFTCSILSNNTVKCFGLNTSGQLGIGNVNSIGDAASEMGDTLISAIF